MSEPLRILMIEDNESDAVLIREMIDDTGLETESPGSTTARRP